MAEFWTLGDFALMDFTTYSQFRDAALVETERQRIAAMAARREKNAADFKILDRRELSAKSDKDLAEWQSRYDTSEPQWRLAEHEWQRRLTAEQIRATMSSARWQAWFCIFGAIIGSLITLIAEFLAR